MSGSGNTASTLFREVKIFDGRSDQLTDPTDVLITGDTIATISPQVESPAGDEQRTVIDGGGRVLMPGLIDAHAHLWSRRCLCTWAAADSSYIDIVSGIAAQALLMRGFTTVRDAGGPVFGLKGRSTRDSSSGRGFSRRVRLSRKLPGTATTAAGTRCRAGYAVTCRIRNSWEPGRSLTASARCCGRYGSS